MFYVRVDIEILFNIIVIEKIFVPVDPKRCSAIANGSIYPVNWWPEDFLCTDFDYALKYCDKGYN